MALQVLAGLTGAAAHALARLGGPMIILWENAIYDAPVLAPLPFADLAVPALWALARRDLQISDWLPSRIASVLINAHETVRPLCGLTALGRRLPLVTMLE